MKFIGSVDVALNKLLPSSAEVGATYIVASAGKYIVNELNETIFARAGDLFINAAEEDGDVSWVHVNGGYEENYLQKIISGKEENR
jgi:hypothetical protein